MKPWMWVIFLAAAILAHYVLPEEWSYTIGGTIMFISALLAFANLGGRIDELMSRVSTLEAESVAHQAMIDKLKTEYFVEMNKRLFEIERRL